MGSCQLPARVHAQVLLPRDSVSRLTDQLGVRVLTGQKKKKKKKVNSSIFEF